MLSRSRQGRQIGREVGRSAEENRAAALLHLKDMVAPPDRVLESALSIGIVLAWAVMAPVMAQVEETSSTEEWRQWGGPQRNFQVDGSQLADSWPADGPRRLWSRPLGLGHSAIVVDKGRLFTMYRPGQESQGGPWAGEERVVALDATTGDTLWEYSYPSEPMNFRQGAGPHSTPLVVDNLLFAAGTNKQIHAFDKETGDVVWSHDLVGEYDAPPALVRPPVKAGYACSPTAWKDMVIVTAGGDGQSVMAFRQQTGELVWASGDFLISPSTPLLVDVDGETQLIVLGGQTVNGLDPDTGRVIWSHEHDTAGDMNNATPLWGGDNVLVVSSSYDGGTRALRLSREGTTTQVEELWFSRRLRVMFSNALLLGDYVFGSSGDFGPAILTALEVATGAEVWQARGFGRSSFVYADGKVILLDEDGRLALARFLPEGLEVLSEASVLDTTAWSAPSLVGSTLYVRDREQVVALDLGVP